MPGPGAGGPGAGGPGARAGSLDGDGPGGDGQVLLLVWDAVPGLPQRRDADAWDESGRGLCIAAAYSTLLDFYLPPAPHGGKVARALINRPAPPEDHLVTFRLSDGPALS
jgi:hypothetical protein